MNAAPTAPAHSLSSAPGLDARILTAVFPARWRAGILLVGAIVFFPVIIFVMMFNAVIHDMPGVRGWFRRMAAATSRWFRFSRPTEGEGELAFPDFVDSAA
jgi:hypothetical protein